MLQDPLYNLIEEHLIVFAVIVIVMMAGVIIYVIIRSKKFSEMDMSGSDILRTKYLRSVVFGGLLALYSGSIFRVFAEEYAGLLQFAVFVVVILIDYAIINRRRNTTGETHAKKVSAVQKSTTTDTPVLSSLWTRRLGALMVVLVGLIVFTRDSLVSQPDFDDKFRTTIVLTLALGFLFRMIRLVAKRFSRNATVHNTANKDFLGVLIFLVFLALSWILVDTFSLNFAEFFSGR